MVAAAIDYDHAIAILRGEDARARAALAADRRTPPEILFYLAEDADSGVRRTVAENPATPGKADALLSRDPDISVRCALARKIVGDGLDEVARRDMWRMGFTILETLMRDKVVRVRRILSDAFRTDPHAPRDAVLGLARDRAEAVASPILRGSPVLTDADMVSIIADGAPDWAQEAIAGRETVSPAVSEALIARKMNRVPDARPEEPLARAVSRRAAPKAAAARSQPVETLGSGESAASRVRRLHEAGALTDAAVALALDKREIAFVVEALALRAGLPADTVRRMIKVQSARTMVALSWKGGFGARFAMDIQRLLAAIPPPKIINARDGIDYALTPAEMQEQLALFD